MSTKSTISYGEGFHIYEDVTDDGFGDGENPIYLDLKNVLACDVYHWVHEDKARISTTLRIPRELWERIVKAVKERRP